MRRRANRRRAPKAKDATLDPTESAVAELSVAPAAPFPEEPSLPRRGGRDLLAGSLLRGGGAVGGCVLTTGGTGIRTAFVDCRD